MATKKRAIVTIPIATKTGEVEFAEAFGGVPTVNATLSLPSSSAQALGVSIHTVTAAGFTWRLSAPTPSAGYKLHWSASRA